MPLVAQTPQYPTKEYVRMGGQVVAIENATAPLPMSNASFEADNLSGWQVSTAGIFTSGVNGAAESGSYAAYINTVSGTSLAAGASQIGGMQNQTAVTAQTGDVYSISYWSKPTATGIPSSVLAFPAAYVAITYTNGISCGNDRTGGRNDRPCRIWARPWRRKPPHV